MITVILLLRLASIIMGAAVCGRMFVGYRKLHRLASPALKAAALTVFVFSASITVFSIVAIRVGVVPSPASLVHVAYFGAFLFAHRFMNKVVDATYTPDVDLTGLKAA